MGTFRPLYFYWTFYLAIIILPPPKIYFACFNCVICGLYTPAHAVDIATQFQFPSVVQREAWCCCNKSYPNRITNIKGFAECANHDQSSIIERAFLSNCLRTSSIVMILEILLSERDKNGRHHFRFLGKNETCRQQTARLAAGEGGECAGSRINNIYKYKQNIWLQTNKK